MLFLRHYVAPGYMRNRAIRAMLISDSMFLVSAAMLAPLYALFVERIGGDVMDAGITAAALAVGSGVASLLTGGIVDAMRNKRPLLIGSTLVIAGCLLSYALVSNVWQLALVQVIIGIAQAVHSTVYDALYALHADKGNEGKIWGAWEALNYFAAAAGALLGGYVVMRFGFEPMFVSMAILTLLSGLYLARLPKRVL